MLKHLKDRVKGTVPAGTARSGHWATLRKHFLEKNSQCAVCGGTTKLEVHHKRPFHLHPELELDEGNLIVLCEGNPSINCHLFVGHLCSFKSFNPHVEEDAASWSEKLKKRPDSKAS